MPFCNFLIPSADEIKNVSIRKKYQVAGLSPDLSILSSDRKIVQINLSKKPKF
jgi:hypothetical protein